MQFAAYSRHLRTVFTSRPFVYLLYKYGRHARPCHMQGVLRSVTARRLKSAARSAGPIGISARCPGILMTPQLALRPTAPAQVCRYSQETLRGCLAGRLTDSRPPDRTVPGTSIQSGAPCSRILSGYRTRPDAADPRQRYTRNGAPRTFGSFDTAVRLRRPFSTVDGRLRPSATN